MQLQIKNTTATDEVTALRKLFEDYLKTVYWSENALSPLFIDLMDYISSKDIIRLMAQHAANTQIHADRLEKIFQSIGIRPEEKKLEAIESLIREVTCHISTAQLYRCQISHG